jgi:hypothetical protein
MTGASGSFNAAAELGGSDSKASVSFTDFKALEKELKKIRSRFSQEVQARCP